MLQSPTNLGTHATQRFGYLFSRVSSLTDEYCEYLGASRHEGLTRTNSGALFGLAPKYGLRLAWAFGIISNQKPWHVRIHQYAHRERLPSRVLGAASRSRTTQPFVSSQRAVRHRLILPSGSGEAEPHETCSMPMHPYQAVLP